MRSDSFMGKILSSSILFLTMLMSLRSVAAVTYLEGDIVGESEITVDASTSFFEAATASRYGHVGVIIRGKTEWVVYEEYPPKAQIVTLKDFLARSHGTYTVIRRRQALTATQLQQVRASAQDIVKRGVPYNYSQTSNNDSMNCSEFIHSIFAAAQLQVGKVQTVADLNLKTFHGYLWKIWQQTSPDTSLKDHVLTPASVMKTADWSKIDGSVDPNVLLTDAQLVAQWKKESALKGIADEWGVTTQQIDKMAQPQREKDAPESAPFVLKIVVIKDWIQADFCRIVLGDQRTDIFANLFI